MIGNRNLFGEMVGENIILLNTVINVIREKIKQALHKKERGMDIKDQQINNLKTQNESLLKAVKLAYRKYCMSNESIGWIEVYNALVDALCTALGDDGYEYWKSNLTGE